MISRSNRRLKKVEQLAKRGFAGEKTAAQAILKRLDPAANCLYAPCTGCPVQCIHRSIPTLQEVQHELTAIQRHFPAIG
jgi:hypothetical protein